METVEGQAMELGWIRDNVLGLEQDDYLRLVLKKTCCYTCIYPFRMGALLSANKSIDIESFNDLGLYMGVAFQIRDDWLSLCGSHTRFGKETFGDIWEGKHFTAKALHEYEKIFGQLPENEETRFIRELITYVSERER